MTRPTWSLGLLLLALSLGGCRGCTPTGYSFNVRAHYRAPRSGFELRVRARGAVEPGADVSNAHTGTAQLGPISTPGAGVALTFDSAEHVTYRIGDGPSRQTVWGSREPERALTTILREAGYQKLAEEEVAEATRAIGGAFGGPKGTLMAGQTRHLQVVEVALR